MLCSGVKSDGDGGYISKFSACVCLCVCGGFNLHIGQSELGDRGKVSEGVQRLLSEMGDCPKVCVQQTSRDVHGVLPRPTEPPQDAQPTFPLNHPGQLQLNPAASHARSCSGDEPLKCLTYTMRSNVLSNVFVMV